MKANHIWIITFLTFTSCTEYTQKAEPEAVNENLLTLLHADSAGLIDKNEVNENGYAADTCPVKELPFGYADLFSFKFPKQWEMGTAQNDGDQNPANDDYGNPYDNFLNNKVLYYYKDYFSLPGCAPVIDTALAAGDSIGIRILENIKFRLPDFKQYQVYFSHGSQPSVEMAFREHGNLVLYHVKKKQVRFVEIYVSEAKFCYNFQQYFYIDKNYTIRLKKFYNDELYVRSENKTISLDQVVSKIVAGY